MVCAIGDPDCAVNDVSTLWHIYHTLIFKTYSLTELQTQIFLMELAPNEDWPLLFPNMTKPGTL